MAHDTTFYQSRYYFLAHLLQAVSKNITYSVALKSTLQLLFTFVPSPVAAIMSYFSKKIFYKVRNIFYLRSG